MEQRVKRAHVPVWKRGLLVAALLLCAGPFATIASTHSAYASTSSHHPHHVRPHGKEKKVNILNIYLACDAGNSGNGGKATGKSKGANGGNGGACVISVPHRIILASDHSVQPNTPPNAPHK